MRLVGFAAVRGEGDDGFPSLAPKSPIFGAFLSVICQWNGDIIDTPHKSVI